jgi:GT2 family glycosyltransferase
MKVSIIIPTIGGREKEFKKNFFSLLRLLKNQKVSYEIIVLVDESEETKKYLENLKKNNKRIIVLFSKTRRGRCKSKNMGAYKAKGDILLFLDDDVRILGRKYFEFLLDNFKKDKVGAVGGREIKPKKISKIKRLVSKKVGIITSLGEVISNFDINTKSPLKVLALPGCNFAVKREVFIKAGGFDENYDVGTAYREETDLQIRINKLGYSLIFDPRMKVLHEEEETPKSFKKWFEWYFILNTYFFLKNFKPDLFKLLFFIYKEVVGSLARLCIYKKPYPIIYFYKIFEGISYFRKCRKNVDSILYV